MDASASGSWQTRRMVMVAVQRTGGRDEGHTAYIMCSPCTGTGWIKRSVGAPAKVGDRFDELTCPTCYGTGIANMTYESLRARHARS